jgi:hypothetical protein
MHSVSCALKRLEDCTSCHKLGFAMAALSPQHKQLLTHQRSSNVGAGVQLEPWKLDAEDTALLDHLPFLEAIVRSGARATVMLSATQGCQQDGCIAKRPEIRPWILPLLCLLQGSLT